MHAYIHTYIHTLIHAYISKTYIFLCGDQIKVKFKEVSLDAQREEMWSDGGGRTAQYLQR